MHANNGCYKLCESTQQEVGHSQDCYICWKMSEKDKSHLLLNRNFSPTVLKQLWDFFTPISPLDGEILLKLISGSFYESVCQPNKEISTVSWMTEHVFLF